MPTVFYLLNLTLIEILSIKDTFLSGDENVVIEDNIIIRYPTCFYFYVAKSNSKLSQQLSKGFEAIIENGTFNDIFVKHHGDSLKHFVTEKRNIIQLKNPILPKSAPIHRKELWLD